MNERTCPKCGYKAKETNRFCPKCGAEIELESQMSNDSSGSVSEAYTPQIESNVDELVLTPKKHGKKIYAVVIIVVAVFALTASIFAALKLRQNAIEAAQAIARNAASDIKQAETDAKTYVEEYKEENAAELFETNFGCYYNYSLDITTLAYYRAAIVANDINNAWNDGEDALVALFTDTEFTDAMDDISNDLSSVPAIINYSLAPYQDYNLDAYVAIFEYYNNYLELIDLISSSLDSDLLSYASSLLSILQSTEGKRITAESFRYNDPNKSDGIKMSDFPEINSETENIYEYALSVKEFTYFSEFVLDYENTNIIADITIIFSAFVEEQRQSFEDAANDYYQTLKNRIEDIVEQIDEELELYSSDGEITDDEKTKIEALTNQIYDIMETNSELGDYEKWSNDSQ